MRILSISNIVVSAFNFVINNCKHYNIDESHALKHSMEVYKYANNIYKSEVEFNPHLIAQQQVIQSASILHDMCDKKYMDEIVGIKKIKKVMEEYLLPDELNAMEQIILTMSYSKVTINGFPNLKEYQLAYHIVREADLLSAYDFDRCVIYSMYKEDLKYHEAIERSINLFKTRVLAYRRDNLFVTNYGRQKSLILHHNAIKYISNTYDIFL